MAMYKYICMYLTKSLSFSTTNNKNITKLQWTIKYMLQHKSDSTESVLISSKYFVYSDIYKPILPNWTL